MTVLEKIAALRAAMEAEGADGVYVPSSDPHMTEYLPVLLFKKNEKSFQEE